MPDGAPLGPPTVSEEARTAILSALTRPVSNAGASALLGDALRCAAREARERRVPPESLLATLKAIWESLPQVRSARDAEERHALLRDLIARSIGDYFAADDRATPAKAPER